jgi:hypothetical protein
MYLAVLASAGYRDVMAVQHEAKGPLQVFAEGIEVCRRNLERRATFVAREVAVYRACEMKDRGVLVEVCVHDDLQRLELLEDSVHRRRTYLGLALLHLMSDLVGGEVALGADQHLSDGAFGNRDSLACAANRGEDIVNFGARSGHGKTLRPSRRPRINTYGVRR